MDEKTRDNVAENEIERMEDLGQALEESYAHMGNGEYDTDTLLAWEKINEYKEAGTILPVTISGIVNKGVIALVEGVRGFIPVSRLDINHVEDTLDWLGRDIRVRVIEADMERNKLVNAKAFKKNLEPKSPTLWTLTDTRTRRWRSFWLS